MECVRPSHSIDIEARTSQKELSHHFLDTLLSQFLAYQSIERHQIIFLSDSLHSMYHEHAAEFELQTSKTAIFRKQPNLQ